MPIQPAPRLVPVVGPGGLISNEWFRWTEAVRSQPATTGTAGPAGPAGKDGQPGAAGAQGDPGAATYALVGVLAMRPGTAAPGQLYWATDTSQMWVFDGAMWNRQAAVSVNGTVIS